MLIILTLFKVIVIGILIGALSIALEIHQSYKHNPNGKTNVFLITIGFLGKIFTLIIIAWFALKFIGV